MGVATGLIAAAVIGGAATAVSANQTKKALQGAQGIADRLTYQPVDIEKIKKDASDQAVKNATDSLALERTLQPDVAAARSGSAKSINDQLKLGGRLPPDIANQVAQAARVSGGASGNFGGTPGVTAALLGTSALGLLNQRQANAANLAAQNPLPAAGLDPGALAQLEVNQNAAQNQFNASKAGVNMNLLQSNAEANNAAIGGYANALSSLAGGFSRMGSGTTGSPAGYSTSSIAGNSMTPYTLTAQPYNAGQIRGWN